MEDMLSLMRGEIDLLIDRLGELAKRLDQLESKPARCPNCDAELGDDRYYSTCSKKCFEEVVEW